MAYKNLEVEFLDDVSTVELGSQTPSMSPLTLKKSRGSKGSVSEVSLDRRRQERMCSGDALATPHLAHILHYSTTSINRHRLDQDCDG
ncbi:hypothetical protein AVEN_144649-1 [Araneus ventricosus]|uniref:Uncharacterized protein n=1 Tax=Araneus ventricosus TaxID=182803 RepID=A0A4Y2DZM5_ARAVE|nr:hypothetical protein AVEN_144649-1 [Araneus ventricosus]